MLFKNIIAVAFALSLVAPTFASYTHQDDDRDYNQKPHQSEDFTGEWENDFEDYVWDLSVWWSAWFTPKEELDPDYSGDWGWGDGWNSDDSGDGNDNQEHFDFEAISEYHADLAYWWLEWLCPPDGHLSRKEMRKRLKKFKRWKRNHGGGHHGGGNGDPVSEVPVPAAFILFASSLGLLAARKKLAR